MTVVKMPIALICTFLWIGFVCAISFMEAWLKFRAPGITVPLGLGIGRLIFNALNKVELVFALVDHHQYFLELIRYSKMAKPCFCNTSNAFIYTNILALTRSGCTSRITYTRSNCTSFQSAFLLCRTRTR
jgi:uncharacterized membrane protein (DUF485 family)